MGFPRQEYWSGLPFPPPGALPDPGIKPTSLVSPASAGRFFRDQTRSGAFRLIQPETAGRFFTTAPMAHNVKI